MSEDYIKKPCQHCPFRHDVKPFLKPERGEELADATCNPYNEFPCHKTTQSDEEGELEYSEGEKQCAGFLTMMAATHGEDRIDNFFPGFKPSYDVVYADSWEMTEAYEIANI